MAELTEYVINKRKLLLEEFLSGHNGVEDLLTSKELEEYHKLDWPDNVPILHGALKKKIEKDPEYELWVPVEYVVFGLYVGGTFNHFKTQYQFISNRGRFINLAGRKVKTKRKGWNAEGYLNVRLSLEGFPKPIINGRIHRILATIFIPRPEHLKDIPHRLLEVNHIDGFKGHNEIFNLEWCTSQENTLHAYQIGLKQIKVGFDHHLTKPIIGVCLLKNHCGEEIMFTGERSAKKMGFDHSGTLKSIKKGGTSYGCLWKYATNEDIINHNNATYNSDFIKTLKKSAITSKNAVEGTHIITGHKVFFLGSAEMKKEGFFDQHIGAVLNGKMKTYKGYIFKRVPLKCVVEKRKEILKYNQISLKVI